MDLNFDVMSEPIFLVGAERSGTTLLRLMLDCHPNIAFECEFEYVVDYFSGDNYPPIAEYYDRLETDRIFQSSNFEIDYSLNYPQLVNSFLVQKKIKTGKYFIGATVHRHFDRLLKIWSDAKFIHIVRDGRDVARSCVKMNWAGNVWTGCDRWLEVERLWLQLKPTLSRDRYIEVNYEDLIAEPEITLERICDFIGTRYSPAMFDYARTTSYGLPDPKLLFQWQHKLSSWEIRLLEAKIGNLLLQYDCELSPYPPLKINWAFAKILEIHSKLAVILGRINIYGLYLVVASWISRHLYIQSWQKEIQLQCNQIDTARLK